MKSKVFYCQVFGEFTEENNVGETLQEDLAAWLADNPKVRIVHMQQSVIPAHMCQAVICTILYEAYEDPTHTLKKI